MATYAKETSSARSADQRRKISESMISDHETMPRAFGIGREVIGVILSGNPQRKS